MSVGGAPSIGGRVWQRGVIGVARGYCRGMRTRTAIAAGWAVAVLTGCTQLLGVDDLAVGGAGVDAQIDGAAAPMSDAPLDAPIAARCDQIDLLFVIDDSGSMSEEQANLTAGIPEFVRLLDEAQAGSGATIDYHLGITTTGRDLMYTLVFAPPGLPPMEIAQSELGDDGELRAGCGLDRKWLERGDPDVRNVAACRAKVGTDGPADEMPLYVTRLATNERVVNNGPNAGFLRASARLVVVVLTDENDCSRQDNGFKTDDPCKPGELQPVSSYVEYLDLLKGRHDLWSMAIIANMGATQCASVFGDAVPATRLQALQAASPDNITSASICSGNLALALADVLELVRTSCAP